MIEAIGAALTVLGKALGIVEKRHELKNEPEIQKAAEAVNEIQVEEAERKAVAGEDLEAIRKAVSDSGRAVGLLGIGLLSIALLGNACSLTVTRSHVETETASFEGDEQNSGILGFVGHQCQITAEAKERYDRLAQSYGEQFLNPIKPGDGITAGPKLWGQETFLIDKQHLTKFLTMSRWFREGRASLHAHAKPDPRSIEKRQP